jgi:hypothetical protein
MALSGTIYRVAVEVPTGIPTGGLPGQAIAEEAGRKILSEGGTYGPIVILLILVIGIMGWIIYRSSNQMRETLERVVIAIERANALVGALEAMKNAMGALHTAVHDLAREAEGEAKDGRHALANVMQAITYNTELIKRVETQISNLPRPSASPRSRSGQE